MKPRTNERFPQKQWQRQKRANTGYTWKGFKKLRTQHSYHSYSQQEERKKTSRALSNTTTKKASKNGQNKSNVSQNINIDLSFILLRSELACLRGKKEGEVHQQRKKQHEIQTYGLVRCKMKTIILVRALEYFLVLAPVSLKQLE